MVRVYWESSTFFVFYLLVIESQEIVVGESDTWIVREAIHAFETFSIIAFE